MGNNKYNFQKLTPVSNVDISVYEDAIDFVFDNADVKNVAISGAYSAGKSSILESYKAKHTDKRFVHLSLAHFRTPEQEESKSDEMVKESILEGKILNQLIHQIPADRIPQTNFRVKKGVKLQSLIKLTALVSAFIGGIAYLVLFGKIANYISALPDNRIKCILSPLASQYAAIPAAFVTALCSVVFIFSLIKAQKNKNVFRKISLQGNEIEIFEDKDDSYFDKYLNEVLYLFENAEADVIVFEDMDRFNASRIFERLREVNTLVNAQRKKEFNNRYAYKLRFKLGKKKPSDDYSPLRFFYLLRDDIFVSKDRTKFFDYIIPIVPVVDSSNSYEQFLKHLKAGVILDKFDQGFLQGLSLYVDDMRILKNIYNEFVVYFNRLNTTDLDCNKMMAIIAYKNLFPRDFSDLQLARGFISALFASRQRLIEESLLSLKARRKEQAERIERARNETLVAQQEVDWLYSENSPKWQSTYNIYGQNRNERISQFNAELPQRKQAIQDKLDGNIPKFEAKISEIDRTIALTGTKALKDLITRENIDSVFTVTHTNEIGEVNEFKEIKSSEYFSLLKYLIRNGFIDETYNDYMTYFYDDSISANDKTFMRRITDRRGAEYTYALKDPKKVIVSPILREVEFEQEETLNFDLLECLLQNDAEPKFALYLKTLISQIRDTENFSFVSKYYDTGKAHSQFVIRLNEQWAELFRVALKRQTLSAAQIRQFSIDTLYYSDDKSIQTVNADNCLTQYISGASDYLAIAQPEIGKLISGFSLIEVLFSSIDYEASDKPLFHEVYLNSLYELNFENITLMLCNEYQIQSDYDIVHKNYTMIQSQVDSPLATYIADNMATYIDIVLENCSGSIVDDESIAISLLNNTNIDFEVKEQYIKLLTTRITELMQITDGDLWKGLLARGIVVFSESNFTNYFIKHEFDDTLVKYLNTTTDDINFTTTSDNFGKDVTERLFDAVAISNDIDTAKYRKILLDLNCHFNNYDAAEINDDKFEVLIDENILTMDVEGLGYVREKYSEHIFMFVQCNLNEYLALQTANTFNLTEVREILSWDFADDRKIELLTLTKEPISIIGKGYSDKVCSYILKHNLEPADKINLYKDYSTYGNDTQTTIQALALSEVKAITTQNMVLDDALLSLLLYSENVMREHKIMLFTIAIPRLNEDTCKKHFDELGLSDLNGIFTKNSGRRNFEKSKDVTTILDALKLHNWIYEYRADERNIEKYIVIKNKPRSKEPEFLD